MHHTERFTKIWKEIYGENHNDLLQNFINEIEDFKNSRKIEPLESEWYKDVTVYSVYVDLFNKDFAGLESKLDYLKNLGVSCLWLLPILNSPGRDAGFDISDYQAIRPDLVGGDTSGKVFTDFVEKAHQNGIKVIFDIAINHTSNEHPWFVESRKSKENPFRDYYIWSDSTQKYKDARLIFYGIEESNWKKDGDEYFFHRFFDFQPDLNYRNPRIIIEMARNFMFWLERGVDGFRADAIPYLWKEENTDCENLPLTHTIVKFFRAVVDYLRPNTLILAEACQKPHEVVKYFGDGDECHAGYHFPLMPMIYKSLAAKSSEPIAKILSLDITPEIPEGSQWFTFLRCHDELSLELVYVSEEDRKYIHENYCKKPEWDFRLGQGISSRLAELMDMSPEKIGLIYSVMLTLPGTPVIYYGDEFGKTNDQKYYEEQIKLTGKDDTRFLVRGRIDWEEIELQLNNPNSFNHKVFEKLSKQIKTRTTSKAFGRGAIEWLKLETISGSNESILAYNRNFNLDKILVINNLSEFTQIIKGINIKDDVDMLGTNLAKDSEGNLIVNPYGYYWISMK